MSGPDNACATARDPPWTSSCAGPAGKWQTTQLAYNFAAGGTTFTHKHKSHRGSLRRNPPRSPNCCACGSQASRGPRCGAGRPLIPPAAHRQRPQTWTKVALACAPASAILTCASCHAGSSGEFGSCAAAHDGLQDSQRRRLSVRSHVTHNAVCISAHVMLLRPSEPAALLLGHTACSCHAAAARRSRFRRPRARCRHLPLRRPGRWCSTRPRCSRRAAASHATKVEAPLHVQAARGSTGRNLDCTLHTAAL